MAQLAFSFGGDAVAIRRNNSTGWIDWKYI